MDILDSETIDHPLRQTVPRLEQSSGSNWEHKVMVLCYLNLFSKDKDQRCPSLLRKLQLFASRWSNQELQRLVRQVEDHGWKRQRRDHYELMIKGAT